MSEFKILMNKKILFAIFWIFICFALFILILFLNQF